MPFVLLGGLTWGWFSAPAIGRGSGLLWSALGASGFGLFFYLEQRLVPAVASMADRIGLGGLAVLAWEVGVVGGLIFLFTSVLGAPVVPAVAIAIGVGATYSLAMEYLVCGSGADHMVNLLVLCSQSLFRFADLGDDGLCRGDPDKGCGVIVSAIDVVVDRLD